MTKSVSRKRDQFYIVMPFLLLVFCLGSLNVVRWLGSRPTEVELLVTTAVTPVTPTANPTHLPLAATAVPPTIPSTPTPPPSATPYVPPIYSDDESIQLLGPPPDSTVAADATLSFYWRWPLPLEEDQYFAVYLLTEDSAQLVGTLRQPNVGDSYRLQAMMAEMEITAVSLQWEVTLNTTLAPQLLRTSETRSLQFLESR